jgi:RHH-type proline utilization regulon transcriptional repressor/proline dehydrogenase/delta 1-pyrroline-5-carboxylate dehydrogenase
MAEALAIPDLSNDYLRPEGDVTGHLLTVLDLDETQREQIVQAAANMVNDLRQSADKLHIVDALLQQYGLSTAEGVTLMRLAESLIRTPDFTTSRLLVRDKLGESDWGFHAGKSAYGLVNQATNGLRLSAGWISASGGVDASNLLARLGDRVLEGAVEQAMGLMGEHFVLGTSIANAVKRSKTDRENGSTHSYDMLGEAALTADDAARYFTAYHDAITYLGQQDYSSDAVDRRPGISVKLSALHPRYEYAHRDICVPALTAQLLKLAKAAQNAGIAMTIDAEEADRLETEILIIRNLLQAPELNGWDGLGIVVQAYQRRALPFIHWLAQSARSANRRISVRLVKGAYWDSEIKRAQEMGLESYPVFTRKENTDLSYLACARALLDARDAIYPQFATHNAHSVCAIAQMDLAPPSSSEAIGQIKTPSSSEAIGQKESLLSRPKASEGRSGDRRPVGLADADASVGASSDASGRDSRRSNSPGYEFQRLHGMGERLHAALGAQYGVPTRIYAPVGNHRDLLPYLVRRLLENGANSSFVNQLMDLDVPTEEIVSDPIAKILSNEDAANPRIPAPIDHLNGDFLGPDGFNDGIAASGFGESRKIAKGDDISQSDQHTRYEGYGSEQGKWQAASMVAGTAPTGEERAILNPAQHDDKVGTEIRAQPAIIADAIKAANASSWPAMPAAERAACLDRLADILEAETAMLVELCVREAGKGLNDAIAEIREAVDFCRYYAVQAQAPSVASRNPLGTVACISPWNFPLAIFLGQITASLAVGNTVIAKPAEQTPLISAAATKLVHQAGIPQDALQLLIGDGAALGSALTSHPQIDGVCFTGSTATAKRIAASLGETGRGLVPLIAETGGINAMIVDSTALLEQAVKDVIASAFQSAGQRCSACRIICVQDDIADNFNTMLRGAMAELVIGDPANAATDVGPVIDAASQTKITQYCADMASRFKIIGTATVPDNLSDGYFVTPTAIAINHISDVEQEIFGPVLHVLRFSADALDDIVTAINALGFGLTMGLHTRIDARVEHIVSRAKVGNLYVNRNQIGAIVGVQPFGGEGLSGTGPKAGGPLYLHRLSRHADIPHEPALQTASITAPPPPTPLIAKRVAAAQAAVERSSPLERLNIIDQAAANIASLHPRFAQIIGEVQAGILSLTSREIPLPGPTGEKNRYRLCPRGAILCIPGGAPEEDDYLLQQQAALTLITGNALILLAEKGIFTGVDALAEALDRNDATKGLISHIGHDDPVNWLNADLAGIICDNEARSDLAARLMLRTGSIIPMLSAHNAPTRFMIERTVSIDTTAAGGNASLLAM